jgi:hypothetical protein
MGDDARQLLPGQQKCLQPERMIDVAMGEDRGVDRRAGLLSQQRSELPPSACKPESTSTSPSSVSKPVQPLNTDWNQVCSPTSTGPPDQKNFASSGDLPRMSLNRSVGLSLRGSCIALLRRIANSE